MIVDVNVKLRQEIRLQEMEQQVHTQRKASILIELLLI